MSQPAPAQSASIGTSWAVNILARLQSDRVGAFVPNPAGKVLLPSRYAVQCALDALKVENIDKAMANPSLAARINAVVARHT